MLESLRRAVDAGWRDVEVLERIPQFKGFREHPEFRAILERIRDLRFPADPFAPPRTAAAR